MASTPGPLSLAWRTPRVMARVGGTLILIDPHPNALAHRLAGERIVEALEQVWLDAGGAPAGGQRSSTSMLPPPS